MIYKYLVTIRKYQVLDFVSKQNLDEIMLWLKAKHQRLHVVKYCYEIDPKYHQLHYHAVIEINHKLWFKDNSNYIGFRIHWSPIGRLSGALKYITKNTPNKYIQEHILIKNYYFNNYGFL